MCPTKFCNGIALVSVEGIYAVIDKANNEIVCMGSYEKCNSYFAERVKGE